MDRDKELNRIISIVGMLDRLIDKILRGDIKHPEKMRHLLQSIVVSREGFNLELNKMMSDNTYISDKTHIIYEC